MSRWPRRAPIWVTGLLQSSAKLWAWASPCTEGTPGLGGEVENGGSRRQKRALPKPDRRGGGRLRTWDLPQSPNLEARVPQVVNKAGGAPGSPDPARAQLLPEIVLRCRPARAPEVPTPGVGIRPPVRHRGPRVSALVPGRPSPSPCTLGPLSPKEGHENRPNVCAL